MESAAKDAAALDESTRVLAENTRAASEKLRARDELGEKCRRLREQETIRAAVLQRMAVERNSLMRKSVGLKAGARSWTSGWCRRLPILRASMKRFAIRRA